MHTPAEQDLAWSSTDLVSDLVNSLVLNEWCVASYWTVCGNVDSLLVAVVNKFEIRVPWVCFDLVNCWRLFAVVQKIF